MKLLAPAKINLSLNILKKRKDGYHSLKTVFQTISLYDEIEIVRTKTNSKIDLKVAGSGHSPAGPQNIVWKACDLFFKKFGVEGGCSILLKKEIPSQAGLGGGSSDAAATLRGLCKIFLRNDPNSPKIKHTLHTIASKLGADVPFFLEGGCAIASGIGERITHLNALPRFWIVIVKPEIGCSTVEAYQWLDQEKSEKRNKLTNLGDFNKMIALLKNKRKFPHWGPYIYNSFESVVFKKYPELSAIKRDLIAGGACYGGLSGSGSAIFGIVPSQTTGEQLQEKLTSSFQHVWTAHSI